MRARAWALVLAAAACHGGGVAGEDGGGDAGVADLAVAAGDPFPTGAIAFFDAPGCPAGWARYAAAGGRTIVPAPDADGGAGGGWGTPLEDREDRAHRHEGGTLAVSVPATSFAGIAGGGNAVGAAGTITVTLDGADERAGLPYVELLACRKVAPSAPASRPLPAGLVAFFEAACPSGWSHAAALDGRYLVGLPAGGVPGAAFGGPPLLPGEGRTHTHVLSGSLPTTPKGVALVSGCCADGYAKNGPLAFGGESAPAAAGLPYLNLTACTAD